MTYAANLEEEGINQQYLIVLKPARRVSSWTLDTGSVYYNDFSLGYVSGVAVDGVDLTAGSSSTLSAGEFYWDNDNSRLYIRKYDSSAPAASDFIIITYEIHVATNDQHWYRIPTDSSTTVVYFDPYVVDPPQIKTTTKDLLFGVLPIQSTTLVLNNAEHFFEEHLYEGSFNEKNCDVYHLLGELDTANIKKVYSGIMGDIIYRKGTLSITINNDYQIFEEEFRSSGTVQFYKTSDYSQLDPKFEGKPVRTVYGMVDGFRPVNIEYVRDNPTTGDNREWLIRANGSSGHALSMTVPASPASTTTRTYVDSAVGVQVGDSIYLDKATDEYVFVTAVNTSGDNYFEHLALSSGAAMSGDTAARGTLGNVEIIQEGIRYRAHYSRDWTESVDGNGVLQMTLDASLEANLSMANTLKTTDKVYCRVYGKKNTITLGGSAFGADSTSFGNLTDYGVVLFDILKNYVGITEAEINTTSFSTLQSTASDEMGFAIPEKATESYPSFQKLLAKILQTGITKLYQDDDLLWKVTQFAPISASTKTIDNEELLVNTINYSFENRDIYSDFNVEFLFEELTEEDSGRTQKEIATSGLAKYLHEVNKTFDVQTYHLISSEAATLAARLSYVLGERQGTLSLSTKLRFFDNTVDDEIKVQLETLPGFAYTEGTEREREFKLSDVNKGLRQVILTLSDQKGAEDNSGSW